MKWLLLVSMSLLSFFPLYGESSSNVIYLDELINVYDGDTFKANLKGDFQELCGNKMSLRIGGIDTPEKRKIKGKVSDLESRAGKLVARYVEDLITSAKQIDLKNVKRGKYFRFVVDVYLNGESLSEKLISEGFAKPYNGGQKTKWTEEELLWMITTLENPSLVKIYD